MTREKSCDGCAWLEVSPYGESWVCKRYAPGPEGFAKAGVRCGDYTFDEVAAKAEHDEAVRQGWSAYRREQLIRWIEAGRPALQDWTTPVVSDEDEATFKALWE